MGRPLPGYDVVLLDADGNPADEGEVSIRLDPRPVGLMDGYSGDPAKTRCAAQGTSSTAPATSARRDQRRLPLVRRSRGRRVQVVGLPDLAVQAGVGRHRASGDRRGGGRAQPRSAAPRGTEVLRHPQAGLHRDARARRRHLRAPAPAAGPVRAHPSTRVRRHSEDDLGKDPAHGAASARSASDVQPTRKARSNSSKTRRRARSSTAPSSTCRWTPSTSGTPISA